MDNFESSDWGDSQSAEMDYIRSSNNVLAKYFDAFIHRTGLALQDSVKDIKTGVLRLGGFMYPAATFGYVSPDPKIANLLSAYSQVIRKEDMRMILSIIPLVTKPNVIYDIALTIINFLFSTMPERTKKSFIERRHDFLEKITDTIAKQAIKAASKIALIEIISKLLALGISSSPMVVIESKNIISNILTALQIYSYSDKAARAANNLRRENKIIFDILYTQQIEMLYFIVEKKISPLIKITSANDSANADTLMYALADVLNKR